MDLLDITRKEIYLLKEEIKMLRDILDKHNIIIPQNLLENYMRTIKSRESIKRRVCIECRQNLTLGKFSNIERRKDATESICCNCIKKEYGLL
jgi:hypothetical protein